MDQLSKLDRETLNAVHHVTRLPGEKSYRSDANARLSSLHSGLITCLWSTSYAVAAAVNELKTARLAAFPSHHGSLLSNWTALPHEERILPAPTLPDFRPTFYLAAGHSHL